LIDRYASLLKGKLSGIDIFLSGKPRLFRREASIFSHKLKRQKHISALNGALATGCYTSGLYGKK
jgi:hypothetical protein